MIYNQTVVRQRAQMTTDAQQNTAPDWSLPPDEVTYKGVAVQPLESNEQDNNALPRDTVFDQYRVSTRRGVDMDITSADRILWDGLTWSVNGQPGRYPHPTRGPNAVHHVTVNLQRVRG